MRSCHKHCRFLSHKAAAASAHTTGYKAVAAAPHFSRSLQWLCTARCHCPCAPCWLISHSDALVCMSCVKNPMRRRPPRANTGPWNAVACVIVAAEEAVTECECPYAAICVVYRKAHRRRVHYLEGDVEPVLKALFQNASQRPNAHALMTCFACVSIVLAKRQNRAPARPGPSDAVARRHQDPTCVATRRGRPCASRVPEEAVARVSPFAKCGIKEMRTPRACMLSRRRAREMSV
jgi:hypothetical protein